ncbi:class E sortase [Streptomyces sp. ID05-04B]|uniref:class E sortase n=1 Tax=unclassified Streptomyces TaxID=2593676 RepID=UPI000D1AEA92|nr:MULTISPECIES: class E sortase [unclassified Streptomyces]AVV42421.1 class E sortase [Streptomyces sp. P3]MDX5566453.1 class E sortase [Streptomyces sp. ID05-04B]
MRTSPGQWTPLGRRVSLGRRVPVVRHGTRRRRGRCRRALWTGAELLVTAGVLVLLLVVHQLWWTNREAKDGAERRVQALEREWGSGGADGSQGAGGDGGPGAGTAAGDPSAGDGGAAGPDGRTGSPAADDAASGVPRSSQAYAVLRIPRLGLRVPVAEGTSKQKVLNKGYAGHYSGSQQPGQQGNFAVAGHRNTHGEPFRYLNRLGRGDRVEVETRDATYTYLVDKILPQTSPRDTGVIGPVPRSVTEPGRGYGVPGRYLTLTTCTPEYTSRYRLVVWGVLVAERPRG